MRILIIGATGFTGAALLKYLAGKKELEITAIVHKTRLQFASDNVRIVRASLHQLPQFLGEEKTFDYIFHLARIPGKRFGNIGRLHAGIQGAAANKKILNVIRDKSDTTKLIYLSGSLMYGCRDRAVETDTLQPTGFARYYYIAEKPILDAMVEQKQNIIMLRAPWILGKGSWFTSLYDKHIRKQQAVPVYGNAQRRMSLITVEDCAGMLWHYAQHTKTSGVYNIYTLSNVLYKDFIGSVANAYKQQQQIQYDEKKMLQVMDKTTVNAICCEVVLDTNHLDLLNSYKPIHLNLNTYLTELAQHD